MRAATIRVFFLILACALGSVLAPVAHATGTVTMAWTGQSCGGTCDSGYPGNYPSIAAACAGIKFYSGSAYNSCRAQIVNSTTPPTADLDYAGAGGYQVRIVQNVCPTGSTLTGGSCVCDGTTVPNGTGDGCETPNPCSAISGQTTSAEFFTGYKDPQTGGYVAGSNVDAPSSACLSGCSATLVSGGAGVLDCFSYANNISKLFCSFAYTYSGSACSTTTSNNAPTGACPSGYTYGTVNGKSGCWKSDQTVKEGVAPAPGAAAPTTPGTAPTDGSGTGTGTNGSGTGGTPGSGVPGAGTGAGSVPVVTGSGSGSGTETCGTSSNCNVKVDETGTPTSSDAATAGAAWRSDLQAEVDKMKLVIESTGPGGSRFKDSLGALTWNPALPSASCTPFSWTVRSWTGGADWCPYLDQAQAIFAWFFTMMLGIYLWKSATGAIPG